MLKVGSKPRIVVFLLQLGVGRWPYEASVLVGGRKATVEGGLQDFMLDID